MCRLRFFVRTLVNWSLAAALVVVPVTATAGPWVKAPGEGYIKLSGAYFGGTGTFDVDGTLQQPDYTYSHFGVRAYSEVGLFPHVSLIATAPFRTAKNKTDSMDHVRRGFGDMTAATKVGTTVADACAIAGIFRVSIPLYSGTIDAGADATGASQGSEQNLKPALGDGSYDATPTASFGCGIPPVQGWASAEVGPTFRTDGFGTSLTYAVTVGSFVIPDRLGFKARVGGIERLESNNERPTKRYLQISGGPLVRLYGPVAFEATASYIPTGAFVSRGWGVSAGFSFDGRLFPNPWK